MGNRIRLVVQARMNSSRLPGKIMAPLAGEPLLGHVLGRLSATRLRDGQLELLVATTADAGDDATADFCRKLGIACYRGAARDVLARFVEATADMDDDELVLRATADNPLYCPRRVAAIVEEHQVRGADYTSIERLSYVVPEVIRVGALRAMERLAHWPDCREHVTTYFRRVRRPFDVVQLPRNWFGLRPAVRLTIDTPEDLARMQAIFEKLTPSHGPRFALERAYELCEQPRQAPRRMAA